MRKTVISLLAAGALACGGIAFAQTPPPPPPPGGHWQGHDKPITRAEAKAHAIAMFKRLDVNHDGKLNRQDIIAHEHDVFNRIDTNHDGKISFDEFMAARERKQDMERMERMHHKGGHRMGMQHHWNAAGFKKMIARLDTNHDGSVSQDEFVDAAMKRFDKVDTNHDGVISPAERRAAMMKMRQYRKSHTDFGHQGWKAPPPPPPPAN